jgi:alkylhydroperoxidase family enzyme
MTETASKPRIDPLVAPYEPEVAELLAKWMPPGGDMEPLALFRTLAVHPELAWRMRPIGAGILGHGTVEPREREIVIHRTCARAGAEYEWGVHAVVFGHAVGLTDAQLAATAAGSSDYAVWWESEAPLVRLADELYETDSVSDALWDELSRHHSEQQMLELVIIAGWYRLVSYVINAARVPREPWAARFPAR